MQKCLHTYSETLNLTNVLIYAQKGNSGAEVFCLITQKHQSLPMCVVYVRKSGTAFFYIPRQKLQTLQMCVYMHKNIIAGWCVSAYVCRNSNLANVHIVCKYLGPVVQS